MMKVICLLIVGLTLVAAAADVALPSSLKVCSLNDPIRNDCIRDAIQTLMPSLINPITSIGFPSVDPLNYKFGHFEYRQSASIRGNLDLKQVNTHGISAAKIHKVKSAFKGSEMLLEIDVSFPRIFIDGLFKGEFSLGETKFKSKGDFNLTMKDVATTWNMKGNLTNINGEYFMKINSFNMSPTVGQMKIAANGLVEDKKLNQLAVGLFNTFWPTLYKEMLPETRAYWEPILIDIVNKFFLSIPFRKLLL
ncbi:unnamed protein product [Diamesa serratosioi]